ncbi:acyl-CoA dehydrogenase family protein [Spirillospora sp. NPDC052269]
MSEDDTAKPDTGGFSRSVLALADSVRAEASAWDAAGAIPTEVIATMAADGLLAADLPRAHGGLGLGPHELGELCAELGGVCTGLRSLVTVQGMVSAALLRWGTEEQRSAWLPALASGELIAAFAATEEGAGSDLSAVSALVTRTSRGYAIRGRKLWVTFGSLAAVILVIGRWEGRMVALLVESDRPGVVVEPVHDALGLRAGHLAHMRFEDVRVPAAHLVARPGFGLSHVAASAIDHGRHTVAWGCTGLAAACLDHTVAHVAQRAQGAVRLADHQAVRAVVGRASVSVSAARELCRRAADLRARGSAAAIPATVMAKYAAADAAATVSQDAVRLHGATACESGSAVNRFLRDAQIMQIIEGSRDVAEVQLGDVALRTAARGRPAPGSRRRAERAEDQVHGVGSR